MSRQYTFLSLVWSYRADWQLVVGTGQEMQQHKKEEDRKQANMNVNNAGFQIWKNVALQMFYEEGNATHLLDLGEKYWM